VVLKKTSDMFSRAIRPRAFNEKRPFLIFDENVHNSKSESEDNRIR
jgi:hypothetical protein